MAAKSTTASVTDKKEVEKTLCAVAATGVKLGQRVKVIKKGKVKGKPVICEGAVSYIGEVTSRDAGTWVGVTFDDAVGTHNGTEKGKKYFTCAALHGVFFRPERILSASSVVVPQTAQVLPLMGADGIVVKAAHTIAPKSTMVNEKPGSPGKSYVSSVVGEKPMQVVAREAEKPALSGAPDTGAVVDLVPVEKLALPAAPVFGGVSKAVVPLMEPSMQVEVPSTPVVPKRSHDALSPVDPSPSAEMRAKEVKLQEERGVLEVSPVPLASPATSTAMQVEGSMAPVQLSDESEKKVLESMSKVDGLVSQLLACLGGAMGELKELNDKGNRDGGKDAINVNVFWKHIAKNVVHVSNWVGHFVYEGDLRKTPVMMDGYCGLDDAPDSDLELDGTATSSSKRSVPLGLSKVSKVSAKESKAITRKSASAAVPAADPTVNRGMGVHGGPGVAANRGGTGSRFRSMIGKVDYCYGDRGYISHDGGGGDCFFWVNGKDIKRGDKVNFLIDPNEKVRLIYHKRRAFSILVVERVLGRQGAAVPGGDVHGGFNHQRQGAVASGGDLRNVLIQQRDAWGRGNNAIQPRAGDDVAVAMRNIQSMMDKREKDAADLKSMMDKSVKDDADLRRAVADLARSQTNSMSSL